MTTLALALVAAPLVVAGYAMVGYPLLLRVLTARRPDVRPEPLADWPSITVTIPAYNEAARIAATLEGLLEQDYPPDRRQILVVSDASDDGTDDLVRRYAAEGVELLTLPRRSGKTAAENASAAKAVGEIVVNLDATISLGDGALKELVAAMRDPSVGVASGRDVSVGGERGDSNEGESGYVDYEMRLRDLETRAGTIVGASGCFYAMRRDLHAVQFPEELSRDFASVLIARDQGYRSVAVPAAVCAVPRTEALASEYRRKVRTMARGLRTLWYMKRLLNRFKHGRFAWMLFSHKLCRWLIPLLVPLLPAGLVLLALERGGLWWVLPGLAALAVAAGALAMSWRGSRTPPYPVALAGYVLGSVTAGIAAWVSAVTTPGTSVWEPTRRPAAGA